MLGTLRSVDVLVQVAAAGLSVVAAVAAARVQPLHARLSAAESRWASNLRDVANVGVGALLVGTLVVAGLPPAAALLWGGTAFLVAEALRHLGTSERVRAGVTGVAVAALLGVAVLAPGACLSAMERAAALFVPRADL